MIRESRDQRPFDGSPGLIAVFHALRRLLAPRHPPHALSSLAALTAPSATVRRAGPFRQATVRACKARRPRVGQQRGGVTILTLFSKGLMQRLTRKHDAG